jgi:hypothetical protein
MTLSPNPFSPDGDGIDEAAGIECRLPFDHSFIRIRIFDVLGRMVRTLMSGEWNGTALHMVWDGMDERNLAAPLGQYIFVFEATDARTGKSLSQRKVLILAHRL